MFRGILLSNHTIQPTQRTRNKFSAEDFLKFVQLAPEKLCTREEYEISNFLIQLILLRQQNLMKYFTSSFK